MSTEVTLAPPIVTPDRLGVRVLGAAAPLGPLAMAGWALALPYALSDEPAAWIPKLAQDMARTQIAFWMLLVFALTAQVGAVVTGLVARRGSRRIGTVGLVLTWLGFAATSAGSFGYDTAAVAAYNTGSDVPTVEKILAELDTLQAPTIGAGAFIPLMAIGAILLGIALWRGRTVPRWAAAAVIAAFPLILAGGFATMYLNALGWLLLAAGFAASGRAFATTP